MTQYLQQDRFVVNSPSQLPQFRKWLEQRRVDHVRTDKYDRENNWMLGLRALNESTGTYDNCGLVVIVNQYHIKSDEAASRTKQLQDAVFNIVQEFRDGDHFFTPANDVQPEAANQTSPTLLADNPALLEAKNRLEESKRRTQAVIQGLASSNKLVLWALRRLEGEASLSELASLLQEDDLGIANLSSPINELRKHGLVEKGEDRGVWRLTELYKSSRN